MTPDRSNYTRVSTVLYPFSGLKDVPQDMVENAARRGTRVHKICEGIVNGLGEFDIDEETAPYVESFKKWWEQETRQIEFIEQRLYCDSLQLTGQMDYILRIGDKRLIVDLKTSYRPSKTWLAQAQGYHYLAVANGIPVDGMLFLHLKKTGYYPQEHSYAPASDLFLKTYDVYKYFFHKESK